MNHILFNTPGGYPLTQDSLAFLQNAYKQALKGLSGAFHLYGNSPSEPIILWGCQLSIAGPNLYVTEGFISWTDAEVYYVPAISMAIQGTLPLLFDVINVSDTNLDTTYYAVSGQTADVHRIRQAVVTYTPSATSVSFAFTKRYIDLISMQTTPVGCIIQFSANNPPNGWHICNGAILNYNTNPEYLRLFNVIGNNYGTGPNPGDFRIPNMLDRFVIGAGNNVGVGALGGSSTATLIEDNLPPHKHTIDDDSHNHQAKFPETKTVSANLGTGEPAASQDISVAYDNGTSSYAHSHGGATGNGAGNSTPFDIMPPYIGLYYIIKVI